MSVTIRPYRTGGWEVDIHVILSNGDRKRERKRKSVSKSAAHRWGLSREPRRAAAAAGAANFFLRVLWGSSNCWSLHGAVNIRLPVSAARGLLWSSSVSGPRR